MGGQCIAGTTVSDHSRQSIGTILKFAPGTSGMKKLIPSIPCDPTFLRAARERRERRTFEFADEAASHRDINALFDT